MIRRHYSGASHIPPPGSPAIIASNHISNMDWLPIAAALYDLGIYPSILAKSSLFEIPGMGRALRAIGQIPVYGGTSRAADSLIAAREALDDGGQVLFFPEATLTRDPDLWPMAARPGVGRLALSTGVPVIPMGIWGTHRLMRLGSAMLYPIPRKDIFIRVGEPVDLADLAGDTSAPAAREATERVMGRVRTIVGELREETPPTEVFSLYTSGG
jgi:1-acyl-sn-glycerol-3-phosphate acyltransferase